MSTISRSSILFSIALLLASCGFPGPLFKYNKSTSEEYHDSTLIVTYNSSYFCFDYDMNFECQRCKEIYKDSITNKIIEIEVTRGTELKMRDGRKKSISRIREFNSEGKVVKKVKTHSQTYGRTGRLRRSREVEYLKNGQTKITIKKGTFRNPDKLEKTRLKGSRFKD